MSEVIVITSGKGGVGKTTASANIGTGLAQLGNKVVLIDTDIGLRNLDVVLGLENRIVYNLVDVVEGNCRIKQALIKDKNYPNLALLPSAQTRDKSAVTPEQMKKLTDELREEFDYVLLDCPAGIEQGFKNAIAGADRAIVVTTPEVSAIRDIDTFEDQLVGLNIGDEKDVEVTFPEEYHAQELAGKPANFHVKVLGITEKQLPELDDDFAQDTTEFDSMEEYKADIRAKLLNDKEEQAKNTMENALVEKAVENAQMDIPDAMVESQVDQMVQEFQQRVSYQGISFEQYLQFTGQNPEAFRESMRPEAMRRIQSSLVLEAIVAAENIEATEEDLNKEFERMASMYQMEADQIASFMGDAEKENMKNDIAIQKAVDFIREQAVVTEASGELDYEPAE